MSAHERVEALYPLTPSQTGMWLQSQTDQGGGLFIEQAAFCLDGPLNRDALTRALQFVVDRHAGLRSAVSSKGREPARVVLRAMPVAVHDAQARPEDEQTALAELMAQERARGFALNRPPLIRFALLRTGDDRAWLVISFHHVILDGWSLLVLWTEAERFYAAEVMGTPVGWPPAPQDRDYSAWLRARSPEASEAFWRSRLSGFSAPNALTAIAPAGTSSEPSEFDHRMSRDAGAALASVAAACRVSPAIVLEVLWAAVIAGRTRTADVAFAATVSGRPADVPGIERMVGCFINTVPIRVRFDPRVTLRQCLVDHQERRSEQAAFEYCSAGQIHGWSDVPASQPLCQSLMVYENLQAPGNVTAVAPLDAVGAPAPGARVRGARTAYPLTLVISPGAAPHVRVIYQRACLSEEAAHDVAAELERLVVHSHEWIEWPVHTVFESVAPVAAVPNPIDVQSPRAPFVGPRSRMEHQLAEIWRVLFKRPQIGVLDDFFSLGGHSLMALQMGAQVRAALGVELPLHVLIAGPTIEKLAEVCGEHSPGGDEVLIPIATQGPGLPIFCVHPLGGHVLCYASLGQQLADRHPVWGLQARGLRPGESPAATWDEIVDHHWALLLNARGSGTGDRLDRLALVGYSYGGYISMALADRAYRLGATDVRVILLDVPHPSVVPERMRQPDTATLLHALFGAALGLELDALRRLPEDTILRHVYDAAIRQHLLPPGASFDQIARALAVAQAHSRLQPPPARHAFAASLLRAREGAERISPLEDLGWRDHVNGLSVEWVDGRHETMLEPQHAATVAARIVERLAI